MKRSETFSSHGVVKVAKIVDFNSYLIIKRCYCLWFHPGYSDSTTMFSISSRDDGRSRTVVLLLSIVPCDTLILIADFSSVRSGEGSQQSGPSDERSPGAMAKAVTVHNETERVMYFA